MISINKQSGYTDMQLMPAAFGAVFYFIIVGQLNNPEFNLADNSLTFYLFIGLATAAMLFGYITHLDALNYPESPFN